MKWMGHVGKMGEGCGNLRERDHWGDPDIDGMIVLRLIVKN
jgi:hypothetical protein